MERRATLSRIFNALERPAVLLPDGGWCSLNTGLKGLAELSAFHSQAFSKNKESSARLNARDTYYFLQSKKQTVCMNKGLINEISRFTDAKF